MWRPGVGWSLPVALFLVLLSASCLGDGGNGSLDVDADVDFSVDAHDDEEGGTRDGDGDVDTDVDGDIDVDADVDVDVDADVDVDGGEGPPEGPPRLTVGPNGRHLVGQATGRPFFWLSDTAWGLFSLAPEDVTWFLQRRRDQGFSVVSVGNIFPNYCRENYRGDSPFPEGDIENPGEPFFEYLDWIIHEAARLDLYISIRGLGHKIDRAVRDYYLDEEMHLTRDETRAFAAWLGERWREERNLIFSAGQDKPALRSDLNDSDPPDQRSYWRAQGEGWVLGMTGHSLAWDEPHPAWSDIVMTWHPPGANGTSGYFHDDQWLTINQNQSWGFPAHFEAIARDWDLSPTKPTFFGESVYEGAEHSGTDASIPRNIRAQAYVSVLAGGFGYTYGAMGVFFFNGFEGRDWQWLVENNAGGRSLGYLRRLIESRPMLDRRGGSSLVQSPGRDISDRVQGALAESGRYAFVYFPRANRSRTIEVGSISGSRADAWWYSPRDGLTYDEEGELTEAPFGDYDCGGDQAVSFDPPGNGAREDWVLVLDDQEAGFGTPGIVP